MNGKKFRTTLNEVIATVVQLDDTSGLYICWYPWGEYFYKDELTSDNLCSKCSIKIHKRLRESNINEVVECIECGREVFVNDTKDGLCIYCYSQELEEQIKKLKSKRKYYKY